MLPLKTIAKMHTTERYKNVSRALVYKWHECFTSLENTGTKSYVIGQPKLITVESIIKVTDCFLPPIEETARDRQFESTDYLMKATLIFNRGLSADWFYDC